MRKRSLSAPLLGTLTMAPAAVIPASRYNDIVKTNFSHPISNVPGKSLVAVEVSYPPGGASAPHRHSAFVYAYVVSGQIVSQVEGQPERIYRAGESWYETPGAHHLISRNASITEPAKLLAVFIADTETMPQRSLIRREVRDEIAAGGGDWGYWTPMIRGLKQHGHSVFGLLRSAESTHKLTEMGAEALIGDALDAVSVRAAVASVRP